MSILRSYELPPFNTAEILRYARCPKPTPELLSLMEDAMGAMAFCKTGKVCFQRYPFHMENDTVDLGFAQCKSASLQKHLQRCSEIVLFAATLGLEPDRLIARTEHISPAKASMLQAVCTERIEALCDCFEADIRSEALQEGRNICNRYSPGYGDVPLALQKDVFQALSPTVPLGLTLNDSLLMTPTKSVTAIIGIIQEKRL